MNVSQSNLTSILSGPAPLDCYTLGPSAVVFMMFNLSFIFLLVPLCFLVLYDVFQKLRQTGFTSSAAAVSHCDCFTYHNVAIEMFGIFGCVIFLSVIYIRKYYIFEIGGCVFCITWYGELFVHMLTCLERYLAVVHPITYMGLKNEKGIRIRNVTMACGWVITFVAALWISVEKVVMVDLCLLVPALAVISFCCISVLCVLVRPGPGGKVEERKKVDQFKQRAFFTILYILAALLVRLVSSLIFVLVYICIGINNCMLTTSIMFFNIPSSMTLPLLYLKKERKKWFLIR